MQFNLGMTAAEVARAVFDTLPQSVGPMIDGGGRISMRAASQVFIVGDTPVAQSTPIQVDQNATTLTIPDGSDIAIDEQITFDGETTSTTIQFVQTAGTATDPNVIEILYTPSNTAAVLAERILDVLPEELDAIALSDGVIQFLGFTTLNLGGLNSPQCDDNGCANHRESNCCIATNR